MKNYYKVEYRLRLSRNPDIFKYKYVFVCLENYPVDIPLDKLKRAVTLSDSEAKDSPFYIKLIRITLYDENDWDDILKQIDPSYVEHNDDYAHNIEQKLRKKSKLLFINQWRYG